MNSDLFYKREDKKKNDDLQVLSADEFDEI